jgi:hypothetical protein
MRTRREALLLLAVLALTVTPARSQEADEPNWPRRFDLPDDGALVVYQPQIERWDDFRALQALVAISIDRGGEQTLGGLRITADTDTDHAARKVVLRNVTVAETSFPTLDAEAAAEAARQVIAVFPKGPATVSLDRVLANLDRELVRIRSVEVRNEPPQIFVSRRAATMAILDGDPVYQRVPDTELFLIVNTSAYLLRHGRFEQYYLVYGRGWVTSEHLAGPWDPENNIPDTFRSMPTGRQWQGIRARVPGGMITFGDMPEVFVVQPSAELLQFNGEPRLEEIPDTGLSYASNSNNDVFFDAGDGMYYLLLSGRWYRAQGIDSPLQFCGDQLPEGFAKIPSDHPCGRVRPSVPGTPEAKEAVIAAHVPRAAKANRATTTLDVSYVGGPVFKSVDGAPGVEYAVNTSLDVFRVGGSYYACHDAIWYTSMSAEGSFAVCDSVPEAIYSIPVSSPKFHVTYVFVDAATPEEVFFTYYPGYFGTFVTGSSVVFGTGYVHRMPKEFYIHYFENPDLHLNDTVGQLQTYGYGYYYDHLNGRFELSPAVRTHHTSTTSRPNVALTWSSAAVAAVPYGVTRTGAPAQEAGVVQRDTPDYYAGPDGNVYRRDNTSWAIYSAGRSWQRTSWDAAPAYRPAPRVGVEPQAWTRQPATQRGLQNHTFSRDLTAHRYMQYRQNYRGNRTQ